MLLCTDHDLLRWEPDLFRQAVFASQTLLSGTGTLSGTTFTISTGSFTSAGVDNTHLLTLGEPFNASFVIQSVDSATQLTISILLDDEHTISVGSGTNLPYAIRSFRPQAQIISDLILQSSGISQEASVVSSTSLVRCATLGTLQQVYNALWAISSETSQGIRADLYERLFRRALRHVRIDVDEDGDGEADRVVMPGAVSLIRH